MPKTSPYFSSETTLDETPVVAKNRGLAIADKRELAGFHRVAGVPRLLSVKPIEPICGSQ